MAISSLLVAPMLPARPAVGARARRVRATPLRFVLAAASSRGVDPSPQTFERLREQLLQLHEEADLTQSKENSARVRLVRLTEAAENLKKRAVVSVQMGRENEAVDLLVQKKKLTKALENIKYRIEVLEKLSSKISEAISMKQNMLIEHALHLEMPNGEAEDSNHKIRIFSGQVDDGVNDTSNSLPKSVDSRSFQMKNVVHSNMVSYSEQSEIQMADSFTTSEGHDPTSSIKNRSASAYDDFIKHIDSQINSLEHQTEQFISSQLAAGMDSQQPINGKWNKLSDILNLLTETRERISNILDNTVSEPGSEDTK